VAVLGRGQVGTALLGQLHSEEAALLERYKIRLVVAVIANSRLMLCRSTGIDLSAWEAQWESASVTVDLDAVSGVLLGLSPSGTHPLAAVVCDCTASEEVAFKYLAFLQNGVHVVAANKRVASGDLVQYQLLRAISQVGPNGKLLYEANVGAGLPILSTIRDLLDTGDKVLDIVGVLSGTLSFIFNNFDGSLPFSSVVLHAKEAGFTEPDPREDLSGVDVARKVVILAREVGLMVHLEDVNVQSLVPLSLRDSSVTVGQFLVRLREFDDDFKCYARAASEQGHALRYVGKIDVIRRRCSVDLQTFPPDHPFGSLKGADNIIQIRTERYDAQPLTIRGPGAGAQVTAAGVFGDVLRLCR